MPRRRILAALFILPPQRMPTFIIACYFADDADAA